MYTFAYDYLILFDVFYDLKCELQVKHDIKYIYVYDKYSRNNSNLNCQFNSDSVLWFSL